MRIRESEVQEQTEALVTRIAGRRLALKLSLPTEVPGRKRRCDGAQLSAAGVEACTPCRDGWSRTSTLPRR